MTYETGCFINLNEESLSVFKGILMIKNGRLLKDFEDSFARQEGRIPSQKAFNIFSAMWQEAIILGVIPFKEPLAGIEVDINLARILNSCSKKSFLP
ncbi:MAG: hypothetical protein A2031_03770 [Deltaproteobacteria bacterium RBG_19FT_COMBO_43_11]|nr:MAG: hypothetical protein A2W27_05630 [Deltaproteobacteria bacterium RBG_16_44_11]OGP90469.1 MAG: hypothetical protein A2031_03770 [Deltaproteobacteria bacterium RBG_19FT_COMBO_43_11]